MKRIPQSFFLALFVFAISGFAQTPPRPEEIWKEFSSSAGRFKVVWPDTPIETSQTIESSMGKIERHTFTFVAGFATFLVSYSDFPITLTEPGEIKKFLDHMHEGEVASSQGKLLSMAEIELDGYPGRDFIVETPDSMLRMKYFLVGQRFYQVSIWTPTAAFIARIWFPDFQKLADELEKQKQKELAKSLRENAPAKNTAEMARSIETFAARFLDSFRLTGKPAIDKKTTPDSTLSATSDGANRNTVSPGKPPQPPNRIVVRPVVVDEKGKKVAAKKVEPGAVLKKVAPTYPPEAKAAGVTGKVEVQITISEKGQVIKAIALSGPEPLREAAEQAAKQWVFEPAKVNRRPAKAQGILAFNFTLQ